MLLVQIICLHADDYDGEKLNLILLPSNSGLKKYSVSRSKLCMNLVLIQDKIKYILKRK